MYKVAVLARFKEENPAWKRIVDNHGYDVTIFNKHEGENLLENVGREGHTYIRYIIDNYDYLPDEILFSQYDPMDHFGRKDIWGRRNKAHYNSFLYGDVVDSIFANPIGYDLFVRGRSINWLKYFNHLFQEEVDFEKILAFSTSINGIFRVAKKQILKYDLEFYDRALKMLDYCVNPREGFFFERAWKFLYSDYGSIDDKQYNYFRNKIFLFGNYNTTTYSKSRKNEAYGHIKLFEDGTILSNPKTFYSSPHEAYWKIENGYLLIMNVMGAVTSRYSLKNYTENQTKELWGDFTNYRNRAEVPKFFWLRPPMWTDYFKEPLDFPHLKKPHRKKRNNP